MANKEKVTITWSNRLVKYSEIESSEISYLNKRGFFCIISGIYKPRKDIWGEITLLYIGQAFSRTLREKIINSYEKNDLVPKFIEEKEKRTALIMGGKITDCSVKEISKPLYNNIVNCLISANKPIGNPSYQENFTSRILEITNMGSFFPLKEKSIFIA